MTQVIEFEGAQHEFPDDFTDADIATALGGNRAPLAPTASASFVPYDQQQARQNARGEWVKTTPSGSDVIVPIPKDKTSPVDLSKIPRAIGDVGREFSNVSTLGLADKGEAGLNSLFNGKSYADSLADEQAKDAALNPQMKKLIDPLAIMASPVTRMIGAGVSSFIPTEGSGLFAFGRRAANYGTQGGLLNLLYQSTLGDPDKVAQGAAGAAGAAGIGMVTPPDGATEPFNLLGAAKTFGAGAVAGAAGPAALEAGGGILSTALRPILSRLHPDDAAIAALGKALDRGNLTPDMLAAKDAKLGPDGMLANTGGAVTDFARDIAQFPGRARSQAQAAFGAQQGGRLATEGGAVGRVEDAVDDTLSDEGMKGATQALIDLRTKSSSPLWKQMFATPRVPDSPILDVMQGNPEVQRGMKIGQGIARNDANAAGQDLADSNFTSPDGQPTFQAWHAAKEGLDDVLFSGGDNVVNSTTGQLTKYGRSIASLRGSILSELKDQYPEYKDALDTWSGPTAAMRAMELGQNAAKGDARVTQDLLDQMTPNEQDFARIGLADQLKYLASKTPDGSSVTKNIFGNQNQRRNLEAFFPSRDDFNDFRQSMAREEKFFNSKATVLGGSQTAPRLLGADDAAQDMGKAAIEGAMQGGVPGAAAGVLSRSWNRLRSEPEAVRDAAGRMLFTTDPAQKANTFNLLRQQYNSGTVLGSPGMNYLPGVGVVGSAQWASNLLGPNSPPLNLLNK